MTNSTTVRGSGGRRPLLTPWRCEALRTTLWVVPTAMVAAAILLFRVTYGLDRAIANGRMSLPGWAIAGEADASRQVLIGIAAAVITVAGVMFSITILALQLASQQFGPRMLRNFIRDVGTQVSLGAFVATFVYSVLTARIGRARIRRVRPAPVGHRRARPYAGRSGGPDLLHPSRRDVD